MLYFAATALSRQHTAGRRKKGLLRCPLPRLKHVLLVLLRPKVAIEVVSNGQRFGVVFESGGVGVFVGFELPCSSSDPLVLASSITAASPADKGRNAAKDERRQRQRRICCW